MKSIIHFIIIICQLCYTSLMLTCFLVNGTYTYACIFFPGELVVYHLPAPHWVCPPVDKHYLVSIPTWNSIPSTLGQSVLCIFNFNRYFQVAFHKGHNNSHFQQQCVSTFLIQLLMRDLQFSLCQSDRCKVVSHYFTLPPSPHTIAFESLFIFVVF